MELVDMPDLGSGAARCGSSSLPARTKKKLLLIEELFVFYTIGRREVYPERSRRESPVCPEFIERHAQKKLQLLTEAFLFIKNY